MPRLEEITFLNQFKEDKQKLEAFAEYINDYVYTKIQDHGFNTDSFFKIKPYHRLKNEESLIAKAFYRNKKYSDPYLEITDKVGIRFVVLLVSEIDILGEIIQSCPFINFSKDRDFEEEWKNNPTTFVYQSDHYVIRPINNIVHNAISIDNDITCEVQIRTLMQHAYSELTHDTIYKPTVRNTPDMQRLASRSMALIESTDHFFKLFDNEIKIQLSQLETISSVLENYFDDSNFNPDSAIFNLMLDAYSPLIKDNFNSKLLDFIEANKFIISLINTRKEDLIFSCPAILIVYYFIENNTHDSKKLWPYTENLLQTLFNDMGKSL